MRGLQEGLEDHQEVQVNDDQATLELNGVTITVWLEHDGYDGVELHIEGVHGVRISKTVELPSSTGF